MTGFGALFADLAAPFDPSEVKVRSQAGRQMQYITARTVMNRLDNVVGPANWWDEYAAHENSVLCRLTIRLPDGRSLTKSDAGGFAGMSDHGDDDKSGYSDALKRAAVKFGVGRYLYRDGVPNFHVEPEPKVEAPSTFPSDFTARIGASKVEAPSTAEPAKLRDERTAWQLISDEAGKVNDRWFALPGNASSDMLTDGMTAASKLLWLAIQEGKSGYVLRDEDTSEDIIRETEAVYAAHRQWLRATLKSHLTETFESATAGKAGVA